MYYTGSFILLTLESVYEYLEKNNYVHCLHLRMKQFRKSWQSLTLSSQAIASFYYPKSESTKDLM